MKAKVSVVKVGGAVLEDVDKRKAFLQAFFSLATPKVLVHGGGRRATDVAARLGVEAPMIDGRRITSPEMMDIALMVYGGLVNKTLVAQLQSYGIDALGLTGADLNVIAAHKRPVKTIDYGLAGDIDQVNAEVLQAFLRKNQVPVMAPITHDGQGQLLNTNADTIATQLAIALAPHFAVDLRYCLELPGVLVEVDQPESQLARLNQSDYRDLLRSGQIKGGITVMPASGHADHVVDLHLATSPDTQVAVNAGIQVDGNGGVCAICLNSSTTWQAAARRDVHIVNPGPEL